MAEAEQKATYNGLDHEWETGSRQEWTAPPGCGASPVGGGDGTVTAKPPGRFYLKAHTHFFSQAYVQQGLSVQTLEPDSWGSSPSFALGCIISVSRLLRL